MQWKSVSRMSMVAIPIMVVCGLLVAASPARDDEQDTKVCTNQTLHGDYGFTITGDLFLGPQGPTIPLRGVTMQHFDGRGNLTGVDHNVINGVPPTEEWREISGTYTVNPDCTGKGQIIFSPTSSLNLHFVVVNKGREIHQVVDGNAVTTVGIKVN